MEKEQIALKESSIEKNNEEMLSKTAFRDDNHKEKIDVLEQVNDPRDLLRIVYNSMYIRVQMAAVEKIDDQAKLADIALVHSNFSVRMAALKRLNDQKKLFFVANSGNIFTKWRKYIYANNRIDYHHRGYRYEDSVVRCAAVDKIDDVTLLTRITKRSNGYISRYAFCKLEKRPL